MPKKGGYRLLLGVVLVVSAVGLATATPGGAGGPADGAPAGGATADGARDPPDRVPPRDGITVVTTDSNVWLADEGAGPRQSSELLAYAPDGDRIYYNDSHDRYWDVDPSPVGDRTVLYAASDHLGGPACNATTVCTRNVVERVNLTTGEVTRLYERITPHKHATRWHDVDRIDEDRYVVADIYRDGVFVVNVTSGVVEWEWTALAAYDPGSGGPFPDDWTHLNDVEVLADGRIVASVRNLDRVVFLDRERGLLEEWTLNPGGDHEVLYQQHNPDYVPEENGGPAVVVADSENNRLVEYQRTDGEWTRTWTWQDPRLQWPRDADRLPNGNTLVADSNGDRVLEVAPDGDVVWSLEVAFPYEVERLGTGDESTGGPSATEAGLESRTTAGEQSPDADPAAQGWVLLKDVIPARLLNSIVYVTPSWFGPQAAVALVGLVGSALAWAALEYRWSSYRLAVRRPFTVEERR